MTAPAPSAELCGHRWQGSGPCVRDLWTGSDHRPTVYLSHRCDEPAHPSTTDHRCRCGATTTRKD